MSCIRSVIEKMSKYELLIDLRVASMMNVRSTPVRRVCNVAVEYGPKGDTRRREPWVSSDPIPIDPQLLRGGGESVAVLREGRHYIVNNYLKGLVLASASSVLGCSRPLAVILGMPVLPIE
jgi:hypothetical protein